MTAPNDRRAAMAQAVELARAGRHREAMEQATALIGEDADDAMLAHMAGHIFQLGGDPERALAQFGTALRLHPNLHFSEMEIGTIHRDANRLPEALHWFEQARRSAPSYALAYRRAAEMQKRLGRHAEALEMLRQANLIEPGDAELAAELVDSLIFHDRRDDARQIYEGVAAAGRLRQGDLRHYVTLLTELGAYRRVLQVEAAARSRLDAETLFHVRVLSGHAKLALATDRDQLLADAAARESGPRWLDTGAVIARLRAAVEQAQPLSLIRLGDGEARFLSAFDPWLRRRLSAEEADLLGEMPFRAWFGQSMWAFDPAEIARLQAAAVVAFEQADILGVATADRLRRDNIHIGYLAHAETLIASILRSEAATGLTDAFVHLALHRLSPHLRSLLAGLDSFAMISPHPGLAARLAAACGVAQAIEYLVPGETLLLAESAGRSMEAHFPNRYHALRAELAVPRRGTVFLVAAGLPGKIYCHVIKQRGGIAIDIGSIADAWMGFVTRPGAFEPIEDWKL